MSVRVVIFVCLGFILGSKPSAVLILEMEKIPKMNKINIITSNTRGIGDRKKRKLVFAHTKNTIGKGIALLQETHSCANKAHEWVNDWDGPLILNHGTSAARGTAILITKDLEHKLGQYEHDTDGRLQLVSIEMDKQLFLIVNIYNNNTETEQIATLEKLETLMERFLNIRDHNIIIGGDWNFILDASLDAEASGVALKIRSIAQFTRIKEKFGMCDIYRVMNPNTKKFTWRGPGARIKRRLDYFLVSTAYQCRVNSCLPFPEFKSDHSPVVMKINIAKKSFTHGKGYWKYNATLANKPQFCEELRQEIRNQLTETAQIEPQMKWELLKFNIRRFCRKFAKELAEQTRRNEKLWTRVG